VQSQNNKLGKYRLSNDIWADVDDKNTVAEEEEKVLDKKKQGEMLITQYNPDRPVDLFL